MSKEDFDRGMATRRKVMGDAHIKKRAAGGDRYTTEQYRLVTEFAWGMVWSRPNLPLKTRSLITLAMITALDKPDELKGHIQGALNNGNTPDEIMEVFHHASVYCGIPAANGSLRVAVEVFKELGLLPEPPR
jgi:4-carboxymuconolactone decarboxylase